MTNIRAVSKAAGVSVATVSRALQKPEVVTKETREKVIKAAKEVGYKPNMMARNFRSKKSYSIMVLVPDISNPFFSMVIGGIQKAAKAKGYNILLGNTMGDKDTERELANLLHTNQADGIIQLSSRFPLAAEEAKGDQLLPIVNCCECVDDDSMPTVALDNDGASRAMTEHLISEGHTRIGVITGPSESPLTKTRLRGYEMALVNAGLEIDQELHIEGDYTLEAGCKAATTLLKNSNRPSAIVCFNDEMAIGAMRCVKAAGLRVPEDVSVTGFDDLSFAAYTDPPLTTIAQPTEAFGTEAIALLVDIIEGKSEKQHLTLPFELVVRESAGKL